MLSPPKSRALFLCAIISALSSAGVMPALAADGCSAADFRVARSFDVGTNDAFRRVALVTADLNGDGKPDIVATDFVGNAVAVFLNDGSGWFATPTKLGVGTQPAAIALGDFNGDSKLDIVVANSGGTNVSVLLGAGNGVFGTATNFETGNGPGSVTVADFNGDGKLDVAAGNVASRNLSVLLGNGAGAFSPAPGSPLALGGQVLAVNSADFNSDGKRDLIVGMNGFGESENGFFVLTGDGAGGFSAPLKVFGGAGLATSTSDLNGDSKPDLLLGHFGGMVVLIGDGAGGFSAPTLFNLEAGGGVDSVAVGDLDADGKPDVVASSMSVGITFFKGDGGGGFTRGRTYVAKSRPSSAILSDFDGDGKPDVAVGGPSGSLTSFSIILNTGAGSFAAPHAVAINPNPGSAFVGSASDSAVDDFNGDGRPDLAVTYQGQFVPAIVVILLNDASGGFIRLTPISYPPSTSLSRVVTADFNKDGKADIAVAGTRSVPFTPMVAVSLGNGDGTFAAPLISSGVGDSPYDIALGEFNNDGNLDMVLVSGSSQNYTIVFGNGFGVFTFGSTQSVGTRFDRVAVGDFNGDSSQDLVITDFDDSRLVVLQNNGSGSFTVSQSFDLPGRTSAVVVDDFNSDGKRDIAAASQVQGQAINPVLEEGRVSVLIGNGTGGFAAPVSYKTTSMPEDLLSRDLDADGKPDLAVADRMSSILSVLSGDGAGGFRNPVAFDVPSGTLAVGDFDLDTHVDLVSGLTILFGKLASAEPCLLADDAVVTEGDAGPTAFEVPIRLSAPSAQVVKINYSLRGFTASDNNDFAAGAGTLTFQPGETNRVIVVPILGDVVDESDESFALILSSPLNARISDGVAKLTILDNDLPPTMSVNDVTVAEGNSVFNPNAAAFVVTLSAPSSFTITVNFAVADGTATASNDFDPSQGTLTFPAGTTSRTINVGIRGDLTYEPDETFVVNLSSPVNSTIADGQGQATILNDDPVPGMSVFDAFGSEGTNADNPMSVTVRLSNPSSLSVSANFATVDGTATAGSDYVSAMGTVTFSPGEIQKTFNVTVKDDIVDEVHENFSVNLSTLVNATLVDGQANCEIRDNDGPAISISDVTVLEGQSGSTSASFTISLSATSPQSVGVRVITANGTAISPSDYQIVNRFAFVPVGSTTVTLNVNVVGDLNVEADETFFVNLSEPQEGTIGDAQGVATITNDDARIQFGGSGVGVAESDSRANLTVTRVGATFSALTVNYSTSDGAGLINCNVLNGIASSRCDYATSIGKLSFAVGETSKTVSIPIVDDAYAEGSESFSITLSGAVGAPLGSPATATITINDNETTNGTNPIDGTAFFVRQHYIDFLGREPDPGGFAAWQAVINNCTSGDTSCDRIHVSSAFFRSPEFQGRGYFVYRFYPVSFGAKPDYVQFMPDLAKVSGFLSDAELEAAKVAFVAEFMSRPGFVTKFNGLNDTQYVDTLLATAGVAPHQFRDFWIAALGNGARTRATVLRDIAESPEVYNKYFNQAFVVMQYFGYLRRDPDALYLDWIQVLDTSGDFRGMVNGFMNSNEYRFRFGP